MPKTPKNFYIFRHGECPLNVSGRIQGQTFDGELTEKGRAQARRAGRKLQNKNIEIIVSSPMKRARQTAAIVASYVKGAHRL
ncbi:MAG: histidine phosphatase family protein [Alphaproteobacteria bacterium]